MFKKCFFPDYLILIFFLFADIGYNSSVSRNLVVKKECKRMSNHRNKNSIFFSGKILIGGDLSGRCQCLQIFNHFLITFRKYISYINTCTQVLFSVYEKTETEPVGIYAF